MPNPAKSGTRPGALIQKSQYLILIHNLKIGARSSSFACERVQNGYLFDMLCT